MRKRISTLGLAVLLATVAGCGKDEPKPTTASCNLPAYSMCLDLNPILPGDDAQCAQLGGVWSPGGACPTASLVGTCSISDPSQTGHLRFYLPIDDTSAHDACVQNGGTYTPTCAYLQGSCDMSTVTAEYQCIQYYCGITTAQATMCGSAGGTWSTNTTCSTTNLVGTCRVTSAGASATYFYYPTFDDGTAAADCASMGGIYTP